VRLVYTFEVFVEFDPLVPLTAGIVF